MARILCQLLEQSDSGWVVLLGKSAPSEAKGNGTDKARFSRTTGVDGKPQQAATVTLDEPGYTPPAIAERASCKVIFDGVLYNHAELANRFADSSDPAAVSDADLILRAYLHWGEDVLHNVKGIFALFIWDGRRDALLCARDPLGIYPLFYADTGRALLFSTSIEALVRHPGVSDAVSRTALADYMAHRPHVPEETFFEAVKRVSPGHAMRVKGKDRHDYRYWNPVPDVTDVDWVSEDELGRFDELLDQAVNRCLQLGPVGIFLSGGLDSVSVAAVAADNSRRMGLPDPLALSLIFPSPEVNEE
jgi:asparagine synthase (glutamine-hydrolysing)